MKTICEYPMEGSKFHFQQSPNKRRREKRHQQGNMANDKGPLGQLKDLVELKDQLEDIQRRMEDEIQAGVPPGGSLLASPFLKGFLAGYVVARLRSSALLGVAVGTCTGIYAAQNYAVPNIENTVKDYIRNLKGGRK
ncbi:SLC35A4 upstream open reading frame protein [Etheostoma spectabile]|nr:SLC35A4 upstream open reading frame protein-like [Etheostoma spectabile]